MKKTYMVTKEKCEENINNDFVCERCGRGIVAIETFDNSWNPTYWSGCMHWWNIKKWDWGHFTWWVPKRVRELAIKLVLSWRVAYSYMEYKKDANEDEKEYWWREQLSWFCSEIMRTEYLKDWWEPHFRKSKKEFFEKR